MTTEQEGVSPATAGGASAPMSAFTAAGKALADAYITQSRARSAFFAGLVGGLSADQESNAAQEADRSTCPNCWGDLPPDPRDAEIERLRYDLGQSREDARRFAAEIERLREELRAEDPRDGERVELLLELSQIRAKLTAELNHKPSEAKGMSVEELVNDVVGRWRTANSALAVVRRAKDAWETRHGQLIGDALAIQRHIEEVLGVKQLDDFRGRDYSRTMVHTLRRERDEARAERDRLRAELDKMSGGWEARVESRARLVHELDKARAERDALALGLDVMRQDFTAAMDRLLSEPATKPAEPRRWVTGDPEPEIGTTVAWDGETWTRRRKDGRWHLNTCGRVPDECSDSGIEWPVLSQTPLVEVVGTDG